MLNENIKKLRKAKGLSQEELAVKLNVVRQTVSKWEKGYSVPDAVMLERMAELFEVSVSDLLGDVKTETVEKSDLEKISAQLSVLNGQIARELARKRKIRKTALIIIVSLLAAAVLLSVISINRNSVETDTDDTIVPRAYISAELDEAVSAAIMKNNADKDWLGECLTEGHFVYGVDENDTQVKVYLLEGITSFGFENGFFVDRSGHSIPATFTFKKTDNSFKLIKSEYAQDGANFGPSIKKMFPEKIAKAVISSNGDEGSYIWKQCSEQASVYLEKIGRETEICTYGDMEHILFEDLGVSTEVSNDFCDRGLNYDLQIGNHEEIENGKRYVYQTEFDSVKDQIIFVKFEFETGKVTEYLVYNAADGRKVNPQKVPEKAEYHMGKIFASE